MYKIDTSIYKINGNKIYNILAFFWVNNKIFKTCLRAG